MVAFVEVIVCVGLAAVIIRWAERYRTRQRKSTEVEPPPEYELGQQWRQPTDILYIERLKKRLEAFEEMLLQVHKDAHRDSILFPEDLTFWERLCEWVAWTFSADPTTFSTANREAYLQLRSQIDRVWSGNARLEINNIRVEIEKLKLRRRDCATTTAEEKGYARSLDEEVIDLERDLRDLEEVVARAQTHPHAAKFEDKKTRRRFDLQDEVFEAFERPFEKEIELRVKYNELTEKIRKHPAMSQSEKDDLLRELDKRFQEHVPKEKNPFTVYKKEA